VTGAIDPMQEVVEAAVPRQQLSEVERHLAVRPTQPLAQQFRGNQRSSPPAGTPNRDTLRVHSASVRFLIVDQSIADRYTFLDVPEEPSLGAALS